MKGEFASFPKFHFEDTFLFSIDTHAKEEKTHVDLSYLRRRKKSYTSCMYVEITKEHAIYYIKVNRNIFT